MRSLSFLGCTLSILSLRLLPSQAEPAAENDQLITQLIDRLKQAGIDGLCHPLEDHSPFFPRCSPLMDAAESISANPTRLLRGTVTRPYRLLQEQQEEESIEPAVHKTDWTSIILAAICVLSAAVCAGLIMGILSLDEFMLHIKIRAGTDPVEQKQAEMLLPLVKQRHLVLVSLLLFNFLADECLPLFLDNLMPSWLAVLTSVFLVVFVSEIVPSAVFIGPDQLRLASKISPFAYVVIFVFYPIAYPISKLLDWLLQGEDELGNIYNRGELSALVRLQYEGRLAAKRRELAERRKEQHDINMLRDDASQVSDLPSVIMSTTDETWHLTEINMIDGALNLKTTTARDVCTKLRKAYTIPHDMILDQANMARIYGVGYSRVPVYHRNPLRPRDTFRVIGVLMTRQLIMVPQTHRRKVGSLPLYQPTCVPPDVNMIELLHIFQAGSTGNKGGHMALVCEKPAIATAALEGHHAVPHEAGVIGIITLEDVFEEMIQAPVYDEGDRAEREGMERAEWAFNRWKVFVRLRRRQRQMVAQQERGHDTEDTPLLAQSLASLYDSPEGLRR